MTRPKVDPDKRQRTANACDSCKKRKQKCNGDKPCTTCRKRMQDRLCTYETSHNKSPDEPPPLVEQKINHHCDPSIMSDRMSLRTRRSNHPIAIASNHMAAPHDWSNSHMPISQSMTPSSTLNLIPGPELPLSSMAYMSPSNFHTPHRLWPPGHGIADYVPQGRNSISRSGAVTATEHPSHGLAKLKGQQFSVMQVPVSPQGQQQLAPMTIYPIIAENATKDNIRRYNKSPQIGKPFWGDSSNSALLMQIKSTVQYLVGPSNFTLDSEELEIEKTENKISVDTEPVYLLPAHDTSRFLKSSFFSNTSGLVNLFPQELFDKKLRECYNSSIKVQSSWRCSINLVFAIGLIMACPAPDTSDWRLFNALTAKSGVQKAAEKFYCDALNHRNPTKDIGEAQVWKIQALNLMSLFLLLVSKRSEAHAYHCMAVQSATSLGIHIDELTSPGADGEMDEVSRKNIWQSLFVIDQFMAVSLGRPKFIQNTTSLQLKDPLTPSESPRYRGSPAIKATTRSCKFTSIILENAYSGSCLLNGQFQAIAKQCQDWPKELDDKLRWQVEGTANSDEKIEIMHVNLFYTQSVVLVSRPSFLKELHLLVERRNSSQSVQTPPFHDKRGFFAKVCVAQCCHSILIVRLAFENLYLSPHNMFAINFLFGSALVVFTSQLLDIFPHETGIECMQSALNILEQCGHRNQQARRMYQVLGSFHNVLLNREMRVLTTLGPSQPKDTKSLLFLTDPPGILSISPESGTPSRDRRDSVTYPSVETDQQGYYDPMADIANARTHGASSTQDSPEDSHKSNSDSRAIYNLGGQFTEDKPPVWDTSWPTQLNSFFNEQDLEQFGMQFGGSSTLLVSFPNRFGIDEEILGIMDASMRDPFSPFASTSWGT